MCPSTESTRSCATYAERRHREDSVSHTDRAAPGTALNEIIEFVDELQELSPPLRELLDASFTLDSIYDARPTFFSHLAPHRTCMYGAHRIAGQLHEAFPELDGQPLDFSPNTISMQRESTGLPPSLSDFPDKETWRRAIDDFQRWTPLPPLEPVVGKPETFDELGLIDGVLGPASGEWVVVVDDESDAFVGARSAADIVRFERVFGNGRHEATVILANWEPGRNHNPSWLREWLPAVLEHVLGPAVTAELLAGEGSWLAEL